MNRRSFLTKITRGVLAGLAGLVSLKLKGAPAPAKVKELEPKIIHQKARRYGYNSGGYLMRRELQVELNQLYNKRLMEVKNASS